MRQFFLLFVTKVYFELSYNFLRCPDEFKSLPPILGKFHMAICVEHCMESFKMYVRSNLAILVRFRTVREDPLSLRTLHVHSSPQNPQTHTHLGNLSRLTFYNDVDYELRITCFFIKKKRQDLFYFEI